MTGFFTALKSPLSRLLIVFALVGASCAPGTDGIVITSAAHEEAAPTGPADGPAIVFQLPVIPIVELPAIPAAGHYDQLLEARLGALELTPIDGVEYENVQCEQDRIVYSGDHTSNVFNDVQLREAFAFEIADDGSAFYTRQDNESLSEIRTFADGSGQFVEHGRSWYVSIQVNADGTGEYYSNFNGITSVKVEEGGAGEYHQRRGDEGLLTVDLHVEGGGELVSVADGQLVTVDARPDGTGEMYYRKDDRTVTVLVRPDGSWQAQDVSFDHTVSIIVNPDGSGQYIERGVGPALFLEFDSNGKTEGPDVIVPDTPVLLTSDRFPTLGSLAAIEPPCATIIRLDSGLFFEFNSDELLPEALTLLAEIAPALIEHNESLQVNGHTDAIGTEEYNQDLSERRAASVATALRQLGVGVEMTVQGFGELQPLVPNFNDDGSDDPIGQAQNRRVELVVGG